MLRWRTILALSTLMFSATALYSQEDSLHYRYLDFGVGWAYGRVLDKGMSPLIYKGGGILAPFGYQKRKGKFYERLDLAFRYGTLKPGINPEKTSAQNEWIRIDLDYTWLKHIKSEPEKMLDWFAGARLANLGEFRIHNLYSNNSLNYTYATSLGPAGRVEKGFSLWGKRFSASFDLFFPLINVVMRPGFATSLPTGYIDSSGSTFENVRESLDVVSLDKFVRVNTDLRLKYLLNNGNAISLGYNWDFFHIESGKGYNDITFGGHGLALSTQFRF